MRGAPREGRRYPVAATRSVFNHGRRAELAPALLTIAAVSLVRVLPILGANPPLNFDSHSFLARPGFTASRPPVVPIVYTLLAHQVRVITIAQSVLAAACWAYLALTA